MERGANVVRVIVGHAMFDVASGSGVNSVFVGNSFSS